jgi:1-acyl-sn-glycerol-3-phosphate acyltransferase
MTRGLLSIFYYASWFFFALFGLVLNLGCLPLLLLPRRAWLGSCMRWLIRGLFRLWTFWFQLSGVLRVEWHGFEREMPKGAVFVANHPSLLDATLLLSRLPDAICIFKRTLAMNPAIGPAALLADYVTAGTAVDLLRQASAGVRQGRAFLVFPEGTRTTPGQLLEPLKPGFALVAEQAGVPVQMILIRASEGLVPRGRPWWKPPTCLPARLEFHLDECWRPGPGQCALDFTRQVETHMRRRLAELGDGSTRTDQKEAWSQPTPGAL